MHPYTEKPADIVSRQLHPNGALYVYTVVNDGRPANGWSRKYYNAEGKLKEEENYSHGLLIEKISYDESNIIREHKIWNNRSKQLIDKPAPPACTRHNTITNCASLYDLLKQLPAISEFMQADYNEEALLQSFDTGSASTQYVIEWTMRGEHMSFTICWDHDEISHQWHCHCDSEALYWEARTFLKRIFNY